MPNTLQGHSGGKLPGCNKVEEGRKEEEEEDQKLESELMM